MFALLVFLTFPSAARSVYPSTSCRCSFIASSYTNTLICWQAHIGWAHTGSVPSWIASTILTSVVIYIGSVANTTKSVLSEDFTLLKGEKITYFSAMFVISRYTFMNRFALYPCLCEGVQCEELKLSLWDTLYSCTISFRVLAAFCTLTKNVDMNLTPTHNAS